MIKISKLSKSIENKKILTDINLELKNNEVTFIVGKSGAGKTTLLNLIGGIDLPTNGQISINTNLDIFKDIQTYRSEYVGFVFQDYNLISGMTVYENIQIGVNYANNSLSKQSILDEIKRFGIGDPNQLVETLSGGEKQRVAILRAVLRGVPYLLADEPTGNLDSSNSKLIFELFQSLKDKHTIIIVTHDKEAAYKYGDRVIEISDGTVLSDHRIHDYVSKPSEIEKTQSKSKPLNNIFSLGFNHIKNYITRMIMISLVLSLSINALIFSSNLNETNENLTDYVSKSYLETDMLTLFYGNTPPYLSTEHPFTETTINHIENTYEVDQIVNLYGNSLNQYYLTSNFSIVQESIKSILFNDFFQTRLLNYDIEGDFPTAPNEMIISSKAASSLFGDQNPIGLEVGLQDSDGNSIVLNVVGINSTYNYENLNLSFVHETAPKLIQEIALESDLPFMIVPKELSSSNPDFDIKSNLAIYTDSIDLLYGNQPSNKNEIVVSSRFAYQLINQVDLSSEPVTLEMIENQTVQEEVINALFDYDLLIVTTNHHDINIKGIYTGSEIELQILDELNGDLRIVYPRFLEVYAHNSDDAETISQMMISNESFIATSTNLNFKTNIINNLRFYQVSILIFSFILLIISLSLIFTFIKLSLNERTYELAIIKSMGASNLHSLSLLLFDFIILGLMILFESFILQGLLYFLVPVIYGNDFALLAYQYPIVLTILYWLVYFFVSTLIITFTFLKVSRKLPIELLKTKK